MTLTPDDLQRLIRQGRSARLDWLPDSASPDTLAATITAMANGTGGVVILGITGTSPALLGVRDPLSAEDKMLQAVLMIEPRLVIPVPRTLRMNDRAFVALEIPPGLPHVYAVDGRFLTRVGAENTPLNPRDIRRLFIERGEISFETEVAPGASLDDLDWDAAQDYAGRLGALGRSGAEEALLKRGCLAPTSAGPRPTHAGLLLFGRDPQRILRGALILAARFPGEDMSDKFQKQEISGNLPDMLRKMEAFLEDHLRRDVVMGRGMTRSEQHELPMEAARELVVNAVAHRDYSISGDSIRVFLFRDRMEVHSPGALPGPMTVANLKDERFSRNPALVQVLSDLGFIERLGYGVDRVIAVMRERSLREPEFAETGGGFRALLYKQSPTEEEAASPVVAGIYRDHPVNPRQEAAIEFLLNGHHRVTNSDLSAIFPEVHVETIRRDLADLVSKGILRKLGEKRGSYYILRAD
ncbi:MAG: ATP-binding protein [Anaerolineae bacterium]